MVALETCIGYILFTLSELVSVIPIPANGILHSFTIGLKNSLKNSNTDIEMAQTLINTTPDLSNVVNKISSSPQLIKFIITLLENQHVIPNIDTIIKNSQLQYVITLLNTHPELIDEMKKIIESKLSQQTVTTVIPIETVVSEQI